jgi:hypothetical protein
MKTDNSHLKLGILTLPVVYSIYRIVNAARVVPYSDQFDSPSYFDFRIFPSFRTHGITIIYSFLKNEKYITIFQAVIGSAVWIILWYVVMQKLNSNGLRILYSIFHFILGSSSIVVEHDSTILSESLSISSSVLMFAAAINLSTNKKRSYSIDFYLFVLSIIWFASTKSSNSLLGIILLFIAIVLFVKHFHNITYKILTIPIVIIILFLFVNSLSSDITKTLNTSGTINNRIWIDTQWREFLLKSGYPKTAHGIWNDYRNSNLGMPADQAVINSSDFEDWWTSGGNNFLIEFMAANLDYTLIGPIGLPLLNENYKFSETLLSGWSQGTDLTSEYSEFSNSVLIRTFFWPDEAEKAYLALAIIFIFIGLSLLVISRKSFSTQFNLIVLTLIVIVAGSYFNWWFGSKPGDMARHNIIGAVMLRLLLIYSLFLTLDIVTRQVKKYLIK